MPRIVKGRRLRDAADLFVALVIVAGIATIVLGVVYVVKGEPALPTRIPTRWR